MLASQCCRCQWRLRSQVQRTPVQSHAMHVQVKAKDLHSRSVQKAEDDARRLAAIENQRVLREQAAEKAQRDMFGDVNMTGREREFMRPVLSQAHISVGRPHAIAVNRPW